MEPFYRINKGLIETEGTLYNTNVNIHRRQVGCSGAVAGQHVILHKALQWVDAVCEIVKAMSLLVYIFGIYGIVNLTSLIIECSEVAFGYTVLRTQNFVRFYKHGVSVLFAIGYPCYLFPEIRCIIVFGVRLAIVAFILY